MANEVEASELAMAKEDPTKEEELPVSSFAEGASLGNGAVAADNTEDMKEAELEVKTGAELMSTENESQDSELTALEEGEAEKGREQREPSKGTGGSSAVMENSDLNTLNEEIKETEIDTKPELGFGSVLASNEPKPGDEVTPGPEPVPGDKPRGTDVSESADEPVPGSKPGDEPERVHETLSGPEQEPGDEEISILEPGDSEPSPDDDEASGPERAGKPEGDNEPSPGYEQIPTLEPGDQEEDNELSAGNEEIPNGEPEKDDELSADNEEILNDEPGRDDEPSAGIEEIPNDEPGRDDEPSAGIEEIPNDEPEGDDELSPGPAGEANDEEITGPEVVRIEKREQSDEPEAEDEQIPGPDAEPDSEYEEKEVIQDEDNNKEKIEKPLDDDQDRRNPQYIPKGGAFYEHDNRTSLEDVENKDPQDNEKKKKSWKDSKDSEEWLHDCYNESEQLPKTTEEIIATYGYDIRRDDAPPRARRRRKYGRGPDKYERSWEDEQAYQIKQNNIGRRGRKKLFGKDEFPPLPSQKFDSSVSKPAQKSSIRKKEEVVSKAVNLKLNGNERPPTTSQAPRLSHSGNQNNLHSLNSNRKSYSNTNKKINDNDIKPFRNDDGKWKMPFKHGRQDDFPKPIRTQPVRHTDPPFRQTVEVNRNSGKEPHISHITDGINQMTFVNKKADIRDVRPKANGPEESKINEPEVENPANRQNPKRYSKIRKGFTGIFPPDEVQELDQSEIHKLQQEQQKSPHLTMTQPLNMQNVIKRYAGTYGNLGNCVSDFVPANSSYLQARPIISGIPPQALSPQGIHQQALSPQGIHQQALSPQGIPQQALSPQVSGLPTIELQQSPLAQPNFVPQPMYVDPHYTSDVMGPFTGYTPYSGNQTGEVYQPSRGITYYNTECQASGQKRPPPRRQNAAIPIIPPPE